MNSDMNHSLIVKRTQAKQQMHGEGIFEYPDGRKYEGGIWVTRLWHNDT